MGAGANMPDVTSAIRAMRLTYLRMKRKSGQDRAAGARFNLALQGGGALGALTWGVLDRLAQEPSFTLGALSGASAGALNAAVFLTGWIDGGRHGARRALRAFWTDVADAAGLGTLILSPIALAGKGHVWKAALKAASPYQRNPLNIDPLRMILNRHVDFSLLRKSKSPRIYVSATNVLTGNPRVFSNGDISIDGLLASACIPTLHHTLWIDGAPYWDGGFSSNPPILPLQRHSAKATILVRLLGTDGQRSPENADGINAHIAHMIFGRPLRQEIEQYNASKLHAPPIREIDVSALVNREVLMQPPSRRLITELFDKGAASAERFLSSEYERKHVRFHNAL